MVGYVARGVSGALIAPVCVCVCVCVCDPSPTAAGEDLLDGPQGPAGLSENRSGGLRTGDQHVAYVLLLNFLSVCLPGHSVETDMLAQEVSL